MKKQLLLTPKDCQEVLRVGNTTFYNEVIKKEGFPKPVIIGKSKRYKTEDIEEWVRGLEASA